MSISLVALIKEARLIKEGFYIEWLVVVAKELLVVVNVSILSRKQVVVKFLSVIL